MLYILCTILNASNLKNTIRWDYAKVFTIQLKLNEIKYFSILLIYYRTSFLSFKLVQLHGYHWDVEWLFWSWFLVMVSILVLFFKIFHNNLLSGTSFSYRGCFSEGSISWSFISNLTLTKLKQANNWYDHKNYWNFYFELDFKCFLNRWIIIYKICCGLMFKSLKQLIFYRKIIPKLCNKVLIWAKANICL